MSELCVRCGDVGEDRRTLWHGCFYDTTELPIPFENATLFHADIAELEVSREPFHAIDAETGCPIGPGNGIVLEPGRVRSSGELIPQRLYTLRVCKSCRADWMIALREWYLSPAPRAGEGGE